MRRTDALIPLVVPHTFRFVGLSFLIPGVVFPSLSPGFAIRAAYGDLVAAILAGVATLALAARASWAITIGLGVQRVGRSRPLARNLPRPNRRGHCPWIAGSGVFHPDSRCPTATRYAWPHILAAAAAKAMKRRTNGVWSDSWPCGHSEAAGGKHHHRPQGEPQTANSMFNDSRQRMILGGLSHGRSPKTVATD